MRNELLELYIIYQAKLLHPLDVPQWTTVFEDTAKRLLTVKPLQCLSKVSGRTYCGTMCIAGVRSYHFELATWHYLRSAEEVTPFVLNPSETGFQLLY